MLLKADAAQLEWRVKVYQSQDRVGMQEIIDLLDLHTDNQKVFGLPSRLIAKIFIYRMIFADAFGEKGYRGPAYAYANDADFMKTSTSVKFWESVLENFFGKYEGVLQNSVGLIREATSTGKIVIPSGRFYTFEQRATFKGMDWPRSDILNYPTQGLSADFMAMARKAAFDLVEKLGYGERALFINTVHDDIEMDVDNDPEIVYNISIALEKAFDMIPWMFERQYGVKVNVPMAGEVKFGFSLHEDGMSKFKQETFNETWNKTINANHC
jgi:hypothetical protein